MTHHDFIRIPDRSQATPAQEEPIRRYYTALVVVLVLSAVWIIGTAVILLNHVS